jgi:tRNA dimethylallyltransferase
MDVGTAKLGVDERRGIPHHLFDALDVTEEATVAWYQDAARRAVTEIHARGADAILVGGSGLYVSSVLFDFRFPPHDDALRAELKDELERVGPGALFGRLRELDSATAERVDPRNGRRIVRALEVLAQGEATHGAALPEAPVLWWDDTTIIGTSVERSELVPLLDARVERMWRDGLVAEADALRAVGLERGVTAGRAIGYAQALAQLRGELTEADAIAQTQALTRRYARRQVSWFRRYADVTWVDARTADAHALVAAAG